MTPVEQARQLQMEGARRLADLANAVAETADAMPHGTKAAGIATVAWADRMSNRTTRNLRPDWIGADELVYRSEVDALLAQYEQARADDLRLVRELDVLLNGEEGAAKQASLCDIVSQVRMLVTPA